MFVTTTGSHNLSHLPGYLYPPRLAVISQSLGQLTSQRFTRLTVCCIRGEGSANVFASAKELPHPSTFDRLKGGMAVATNLENNRIYSLQMVTFYLVVNSMQGLYAN